MSPRKKEKPSALLVVEDASLRKKVSQSLQSSGWDIHVAPTGEEALLHAKGHSHALAFVDLNLQHERGRNILSELKRIDHRIAIIMFEGWRGIVRAAEWIGWNAEQPLGRLCTSPRSAASLNKIEA